METSKKTIKKCSFRASRQGSIGDPDVFWLCEVCLTKQNQLYLVGPSITLSLSLTPVTNILLECNT